MPAHVAVQLGETSISRHALGVTPWRRRSIDVKWLWLEKPSSRASCDTDTPGDASDSRADRNRRSSR